MVYFNIINSFWQVAEGYIIIILAVALATVIAIVVYRLISDYRETHRYF